MNSEEIEDLTRHKILNIIFRVCDTDSGRSSKWPKQKLRGTIESLVLSSGKKAMVKRVDETGDYHLYLFMRHVDNRFFISSMKEIFPPINLKTGDVFHVDVNSKLHDLPNFCKKVYLKPVTEFIPRTTFFEKVRDYMSLCERSQSDVTEKRIEDLKNTVLEVASNICEDEIHMHIFGSIMTGLAEPESDVDIYLQIGDSYHEGLSDQKQRRLAEQFHEKIRKQSDIFSELSTSEHVAFVKFRHNPSKLDCDVSFRSSMSTTNSQLVKTFLRMDPRVKYVVCGVKIWMKLTELKISFLSIAQIWLALFFLMQKGVIPSVEKLRETMPKDKQTLMIEGWNCAFPNIDDIEWSSSCTLSKEELLRQFFIFYGENGLSLQHCILSLSSGEKMDKTAFINECKKNYNSHEFSRIKRDFRGPMGIQDPFVHHKTLTRFNQYWERAFITFIAYCKEMTKLYPYTR